MPKLFLFLDDFREVADVSYYITPSLAELYRKENWSIVRNYWEFCNFIETNGVPDVVSLDHDLADEHYRPSMYDPDGHYNNYYTNGTFKEKTGYECAQFLQKWCEDNELSYPEVIICHSMNPIGKKNIYKVFEPVCKDNLFGF